MRLETYCLSFKTVMYRLNSEIKNRNNVFVWAFFTFQKIGTNSVNQADSGDIKVFLQFPGNSILKFLLNY